MSLTKSLAGSALAVLLAASGSSALADTLVVNLAGWQTYGEFGVPTNTEVFFSLPTGSQITGFTYSNLTFSTSGASWLSEFTLSVNNSDASDYIDWAPSLIDASGTATGLSGSWNGLSGGPGPFTEGAPFFVGAGPNNLWVTVYESFDDPSGDNGTILDATVASGTLTISYISAAVPEPGTYALMALGLLGVAAVARRRQG